MQVVGIAEENSLPPMRPLGTGLHLADAAKQDTDNSVATVRQKVDLQDAQAFGLFTGTHHPSGPDLPGASHKQYRHLPSGRPTCTAVLGNQNLFSSTDGKSR